MLDIAHISNRNDNAIDHGPEDETKKLLEMAIIIFPYTLPYEDAMMIVAFDADITDLAMPCILSHRDLTL